MIDQRDITGLVLAGGQGSRMGGVDKGLQSFNGVPLALHAAQRLAPQVGTVALNANRNLDDYAAFGMPVWPDTLPEHPGPLAGFIAGLASCRTPYLVTVPCDSPLFPVDLVARLAAALDAKPCSVALAAARDVGGSLRPQPVFCMMRTDVADHLSRFVAAGGRKVGVWAAELNRVVVPFDRPGDDRQAFVNVNTEDELRALQPR
jgi:molybdopterin-guanine dinucleotide biosynthesis protein A